MAQWGCLEWSGQSSKGIQSWPSTWRCQRSQKIINGVSKPSSLSSWLEMPFSFIFQPWKITDILNYHWSALSYWPQRICSIEFALRLSRHIVRFLKNKKCNFCARSLDYARRQVTQMQWKKSIMLFNSGCMFNLCFPLQNDQINDNQAILPVVKQRVKQFKKWTIFRACLVSFQLN